MKLQHVIFKLLRSKISNLPQINLTMILQNVYYILYEEEKEKGYKKSKKVFHNT